MRTKDFSFGAAIFEGLPRRADTTAVGFDALGIVVVDCWLLRNRPRPLYEGEQKNSGPIMARTIRTPV